MTESEAIRLATGEVNRRRIKITDDPARALYKSRHMHLGKNRSGWVVVFVRNTSLQLEEMHVHVEVYEPDGEVHIPWVLDLESGEMHSRPLSAPSVFSVANLLLVCELLRRRISPFLRRSFNTQRPGDFAAVAHDDVSIGSGHAAPA